MAGEKEPNVKCVKNTPETFHFVSCGRILREEDEFIHEINWLRDGRNRILFAIIFLSFWSPSQIRRHRGS